MTTAREIISDAILELGVRASGEEPTADELNDGLRRLNSVIKDVDATQDTLTAESAVPFDDDEALTLQLAQRLAPMFGAEWTAQLETLRLRAWNRLRARRQVATVTAADYPVLSESVQAWGYISSDLAGGSPTPSPTPSPVLTPEEQALLARVASERRFNPMEHGAVGDGVADDSVAVLAALSQGGLFLPLGRTFKMSAGTVLVLGSNVCILGPGRLRKPGLSTGGEPFIKVEGVSNVLIDGVEFEDTRTTGARSYAITVESSSRVFIRRVRCLGFETGVFFYRNTDQYSLEDSTLIGGDFGVATGGTLADNLMSGAVTNGLIARNLIVGARSEGIDINYDTQSCLIEGNRIIGCNTVAGEEDIDIGGGVCRDITVRGNLCNSLGNSARCVTVKLDTADVLIEGNTFLGMKVDGIGNQADVGPLARVAIMNNTINGAGTATGRGIELRQLTSYHVAGNAITGFLDDGICAFNTCSGGTIENNSTTSCDDGIVCLSPRTIVANNRLRANRRHGINVQAVDVTAVGNVCTNNSQTAATNSFGIVVTAGSTGAIITNNRCTDDQTTKTQRGILFTGASDRCIVTSNFFYANFGGVNVSNIGLLTNSVNANNITA